MSGGPIELGGCAEVDSSRNSVNVVQSDGSSGQNTLGTVGLIFTGVNDECKLGLGFNDIEIPALPPGYSERTIDVCTPSGIEQFVILVKD